MTAKAAIVERSVEPIRGKRGVGGGLIPPNATLVFKVELMGVGSK